MRYTVDRIEEETVVLSTDSGDAKNVLLRETGNVREGDILEYKDGCYILLENETAVRKKSLAERFEKLKNRR